MNKKQGGILSAVMAFLVFLIIVFVRSSLFDQLFQNGAYEGEDGQVSTAWVERTATPKPEKTAKPTATPKPEKTAKPTATPKPEKTAKPTATPKPEETSQVAQDDYKFRSKKLLNQHYEKHGIEMGFESAADYEKAAAAVVNNPDALHKTEKEDGDDVYYLESTNEFVVVSKDGYIRTYFLPSGGIKYYNKQ